MIVERESVGFYPVSRLAQRVAAKVRTQLRLSLRLGHARHSYRGSNFAGPFCADIINTIFMGILFLFRNRHYLKRAIHSVIK